MSKQVVVVRTFDAPVQKVWDAFVNPDMVKQWWGPTGFTCPVADMNVKEGEASLVCMRAPQEYGGMDIYNTWTYTKIVPGERLEFTARFTDKDRVVFDPATAPGMPAGIPKEVPHVVTFSNKDGKTEITFTESGYTTDEAVETSRPGLEQCLDKMAEALAK